MAAEKKSSDAKSSSASKKPLISTITPCYRMQKYLPLFLEWLPKQTWFDKTEIVLDHNEPTPPPQTHHRQQSRSNWNINEPLHERSNWRILNNLERRRFTN